MKKLIGWVLTIVMVAVLLPSIQPSAQAAGITLTDVLGSPSIGSGTMTMGAGWVTTTGTAGIGTPGNAYNAVWIDFSGFGTSYGTSDLDGISINFSSSGGVLDIRCSYYFHNYGGGIVSSVTNPYLLRLDLSGATSGADIVQMMIEAAGYPYNMLFGSLRFAFNPADPDKLYAYGYPDTVSVQLSLPLTTEGFCGAQGNNLTWELDNDGILTVSGTGAMMDWPAYPSVPPWYHLKDSIKSVVISSGVTSIGMSAFAYCDNLTSVSISDRVTKIGTAAFRYCHALPSVTVSKKVTTFGSEVFSNISNDFVIYGYKNSSAQQYASTNSHIFIALDEGMTWNDPPGIKQVSAGGNTSAAVKENGSLWVWGVTSYGSIYPSGHNLSPERIGADNDWKEVSVGGIHFLALKNDGSLWAWGDNDYGQLGVGAYGSVTNKEKPVRVGTDTDWAVISAGDGYFSLAIKNDGTLWAWGDNTYGRLGDGTTAAKHTPVQIGTDTDWANVMGASGHTVAIKKDGSLWAWGRNDYGQLGDGTTIERDAPVQIGADKDWKTFSPKNYHTVAIKTDGTLWAWGRNNNGQLGDGTTTDRAAPVQIGTDTNWENVSIGMWHTVALKKNGSLWAWGDNTYGQLGDGAAAAKTVPSQIGTDVNWVGLTAGTTHTLALKNDGSLWAWGRNNAGFGAGMLGDGTMTDRHSPVKIWSPDGIIGGTSGIDYDVTDVIIPGTGADGFSINLMQETITTGYTVKAFSIDGGTKWKPAKDALSAAKFPKLFNKNLDLKLSDKDIDKKTKQPAEGAVIVSFPTINKRPAAPKLAINYLIAADPSGDTPGDWVLAEKNGTTAVKADILIGVASGKNVNAEGWGKFYDGAANGIPVKASGGKTVYLFKSAAKQDGAAFTPASKVKKVSAVSSAKAPKYKVDTKKKLIKYKANTYIKAGGAAAVLQSGKGEVTDAGTYTFWQAATAKKPASAKQVITR